LSFVKASDLDCIRALFNEKEKELSLAVAKVEELTRQLEELRGRHNGGTNQNPSGHLGTPASAELEKLRRELLVSKRLIFIYFILLNLKRIVFI
jgi:apoptosis-stimulating of p53 protein 1